MAFVVGYFKCVCGAVTAVVIVAVNALTTLVIQRK